MDIRVLRYFLMVAREQSFTRAAEQLHITQPTISRQIAELEEELGTKLFVRGSKCVTLTQDGILLKRRAMEITGVQSELANWFGRDFSQINIAFTSNLATNASIMASKGLAYPVSIRGAAKYWRSDLIVHRKLYPPVISSTVAAWRRNLPYSSAAEKFIEELNALKV